VLARRADHLAVNRPADTHHGHQEPSTEVPAQLT
jgi:hypothetical protein